MITRLLWLWSKYLFGRRILLNSKRRIPDCIRGRSGDGHGNIALLRCSTVRSAGVCSQVSFGSVPSINAASYESGQLEVETRLVALSSFTITTPCGGVKGFVD